MKTVLLAIFLLVLPGCSALIVSEPVQVALAPSDSNAWQVTFSVSEPTVELRLIRTPDGSRMHRWRLTDQEYVLLHSDGADLIRRQDGKLFSEVTVVIPATYVPLPKEYAPFAPYQDGGLLIFSGRYHACSGRCSKGSIGASGPWEVTLIPPVGARVIVDGAVHDGPTTWFDSGEGTKVYVGNTEPLESPNFVSVIDQTLPRHIGERLSIVLPMLMAHYGDRLDAPTQKPMLFASYDPAYPSGSGHQGGALPGQVFMHFYGPGWSDKQRADQTNSSLYSQDAIVFFFAHETAHLFQGPDEIRPPDNIAWIHEGGADAFALLTLSQLNLVSSEFVEKKMLDAFDQCASGLSLRPVNMAAAAGTFADYYSCGMLMNLAVDRAVRRKSQGQRDLFDFWRAFLSRVETQANWNQENYMKTLRKEGVPETAAFLQSLASERQSNPREFLQQGLAAAGLPLF